MLHFRRLSSPPWWSPQTTVRWIFSRTLSCARTSGAAGRCGRSTVCSYTWSTSWPPGHCRRWRTSPPRCLETGAGRSTSRRCSEQAVRPASQVPSPSAHRRGVSIWQKIRICLDIFRCGEIRGTQQTLFYQPLRWLNELSKKGNVQLTLFISRLKKIVDCSKMSEEKKFLQCFVPHPFSWLRLV